MRYEVLTALNMNAFTPSNYAAGLRPSSDSISQQGN
jgi:hypothetical protein